MRRNEIIEKLDGLASNNREITTKVLNELGITSSNITSLINDGVLGRVKRGIYSYSVPSLESAVVEEAEKREAKASSSLKEKRFKRFLDDLYRSNYIAAYDYLDEIYNAEDKDYLADANFYLFILGELNKVPDKYKERAENLKLEDLLLSKDDARYTDVDEQNKLREMVFYGCYLSALKYITKQSDSSELKGLIKHVLHKRFAYETHLAQDKDYDGLIEYICALEIKGEIGVLEKSILNLAQIMKSGVIPAQIRGNSHNVFRAIHCNNFEAALSLAKNHALNKNNDETQYALVVLLEAVVELKNKLSENKTESLEENIVQDEARITNNNGYFDIIKALFVKDEKKALKLLEVYLDSISASQYYDFVKNLIKLSMLEEDMSFAMPIVTLTHLTIGTFTVNPSWYESQIYENLKIKRYDLAEIYLNILIELNSLGENIPSLGALREFLSKCTGVSVESSFEKRITDVNLDSTQERKASQPIEVFSLPKDTFVGGLYDDYLEDRAYDMIMARLDEVRRTGVSILKPVDAEYEKAIYWVIKDIPEIRLFKIGSFPNERIVLKHHTKEQVDVKSTLQAGTEAYRTGKFRLCISNYRKVLAYYHNPKPFVFARLGMAFRVFDKKAAINYLTIATELSKNDEKVFDFYDLIEYLKTGKEAGERKPFFRMLEDEFERETDNYYDIEIDEIVSLIRSGMSPEAACEAMRLNEEETAMALIFIARDMYIQGEHIVGDEYMRKVERMKNKTAFVKSLFDEIRLNRKFYKNRSVEGEKHFVLKPKQTIEATKN